LSKRKPEISDETLKELATVIAVELREDRPQRGKRVRHGDWGLRTVAVPDPTVPSE
jgi:hypothetical protein